MKILAIEASGPVAACAVLDGEILSAEYSIQYKKKHSQSLVPMMDEVRRMLDLDLKDLDAVAVTAGPGSFTGLRIGAATAKGVGLALEKPLIPVPTVDSLAFNLFGTASLVCPLMDARRSQVYTGIYDLTEGFEVLVPQRAVAFSDVAEELNALGRPVIFLGDGVSPNRAAMEDLLKVPYRLAPVHLSRQRAGSLAARAAMLYEEQGEACLVSADDFRPTYLRKSQAERERGDQRDFRLI